MGVKKCIILVGDYEQKIMISPAFLSLSSGFIIPLQAPMLFKLPFIAVVFALPVSASALLAAAMKGSLRSIRLEGNETGRKAEKGWEDYNLLESLNGESMTSKKKNVGNCRFLVLVGCMLSWGSLISEPYGQHFPNLGPIR